MTTTADSLLSVRGLTASVDEKTILHGVNLDVAAGETHVLMGPNGAGKSTLGHLVMGDPAYSVDEGSIFFDGQDVTELSCASARALACSCPSRHRWRSPACRCPASCAPPSPAARASR